MKPRAGCEFESRHADHLFKSPLLERAAGFFVFVPSRHADVTLIDNNSAFIEVLEHS
jgi:hypothetical protein